MWNRYFRPHGALNFGVRGDKVEDVLWRVENGEIPKGVKYTVIHCGTNNVDRDEAGRIATAIIQIGKKVQCEAPETHIKILGILPRDLDARSWRRRRIRKVNEHLHSRICRLDGFRYVEPDPSLLKQNGWLNEAMYYHDDLHLVEAGVEVVSRSIAKVVAECHMDNELGNHGANHGGNHGGNRGGDHGGNHGSNQYVGHVGLKATLSETAPTATTAGGARSKMKKCMYNNIYCMIHIACIDEQLHVEKKLKIYNDKKPSNGRP
jgi:platelet-activating factor acetylhydrolase IB subunit beta/gamma